jgi:hypothetical protein
MVSVVLRLALAWLLLLSPVAAFAQTDARMAEVRIKAAFLYKFGEFVEWPPSAFAQPDSPLVIGVLGAEDIASELERVVAGRTVQGRSIAVRRLPRSERLGNIHVLFIGQAESARLPEILGAAKGLSVLTVTESEPASTAGSMINFVPVADKIRFDIALPPVERGQLRISARLLAVARKVVTG